MHVLHTHWHTPADPADPGGLLFWLEDSAAPQPPRLRGRIGTKPRPHPFCAEPQAAWEVLRHFGAGAVVEQLDVVILWLPTTRTGPLPSPQLVHEWELVDTSPTLAPWQVTGAVAAPLAGFILLNSLSAAERLPPGLALGDDTRYWQITVNLVLETLARHKLLPVLAPANAAASQFHARWLPVLDEANDGPRLARLLAAMPPLCRAETSDPEQAPAPRVVFDSFLNTMSDALAREWGRPAAPPRPAKRSGAGLQWLTALFMPAPDVNAPAAQLRQLQHSHRAWLRQLHVAGDKTFRIAFRLEAPAQQTSATAREWLLHFLLQARDDPSLLVPARQVWQTKGSALKLLDRRFERPQEKLLAGLGYAVRVAPALKSSLKNAKPEAIGLNTEEVFGFLRESAPLLESSGFGILTPPWWNRPGSKLGVRLKLSPRKKQAAQTSQGVLNFDNLINYRWELSLGDTPLTEEEFAALAALKSPLVQIRGQWVQLDPDQIEAAIRFWEQQSAGQAGLLDALQLSAAEEVNGLPIIDTEFEDWLAEWQAKFTGREKLAELPPPDTLEAALRPYQQYGYSWLAFLRRWGLGACLADDMGLGKTIQTIALLLRQKEQEGQLPAPALLICPTSVVSNWEREVAKFAPALTTMMHQGTDRLAGDAFRQQAAATDMVLTSYAIARRDAELLQGIDWLAVVLDEAQNIKNPEAKQTQAIRKLPADFRLALTGTPVENRLSELWSIMQFLNPGYLGSQRGFRQEFGLPIERYADEQAARRLRQLVSPLILRRVKTDPTVIQDLPDKVEMKEYCHLSEEQATLYEAVVKTALEEVESSDGIQRRGLVLSMLMQLKQVCNHPAQYLHQVGGEEQAVANGNLSRSGKLARLVEMLEEALDVGDRVLIFTQFAEMGELLRHSLQTRLNVPAIFLHGSVPAKKRQAMVERFQDDPHGPPIFILSLKAGGVGLNLTRANHVFHFDRWWNPAVENQATDRAFRIGQQRNVQVHKFVCAGTLEERIDEMIESKKALAESIVGQGENWLTELSTTELREMVTLRKEAVA
jgi:SNF2 family DNA or RNA helicase